MCVNDLLDKYAQSVTYFWYRIVNVHSYQKLRIHIF